MFFLYVTWACCTLGNPIELIKENCSWVLSHPIQRWKLIHYSKVPSPASLFKQPQVSWITAMKKALTPCLFWTHKCLSAPASSNACVTSKWPGEVEAFQTRKTGCFAVVLNMVAHWCNYHMTLTLAMGWCATMDQLSLSDLKGEMIAEGEERKQNDMTLLPLINSVMRCVPGWWE